MSITVSHRSGRTVIHTPTRSIIVPPEIHVYTTNKNKVKKILTQVNDLLFTHPTLVEATEFFPADGNLFDFYRIILFRKHKRMGWAAMHSGDTPVAGGVLHLVRHKDGDYWEAQVAAARPKHRGRGIYPFTLKFIRKVTGRRTVSSRVLSPSNIAQWSRTGVWDTLLNRFVVNPKKRPPYGASDLVAWAAVEAI